MIKYTRIQVYIYLLYNAELVRYWLEGFSDGLQNGMATPFQRATLHRFWPGILLITEAAAQRDLLRLPSCPLPCFHGLL